MRGEEKVEARRLSHAPFAGFYGNRNRKVNFISTIRREIRGRSPTEYIIMRNFLLIFVEIRTIIRRESIELIFFRKIYRGKARNYIPDARWSFSFPFDTRIIIYIRWYVYIRVFLIARREEDVSGGAVSPATYSVNYKTLMSNGRLNAWKVEEEVPLVLRVKASPVVHARRRRLDHLALALRTPFYLVLFLPLKEGSQLPPSTTASDFLEEENELSYNYFPH